MVLPPELLPYAENIYRRFPEEFIALGMPSLEDSFDVRPTSRRMFETPTEKTIEIVLRRRQQQPPVFAPFPPPVSCGGLFLGANGQVPPYAAWTGAQPTAADAAQQQYSFQLQQQYQMQLLQLQHQQQQFQQQQQQQLPQAHIQPQAAPAPPAQEDPIATQRLAHLEAALTALKPQIEALLLGQMAQAKPQAVAVPAAATTTATPDALHRPLEHAPGASATAMRGHHLITAAATAANTPPNGVARAASPSGGGEAGPVLSEGGVNRLRDRRNINLPTIVTPSNPQNKPVPLLQPAPGATTAQQEHQHAGEEAGQAQEAAPQQESPSSGALARQKDGMPKAGRRPTVQAVRVAPSSLDPQSPRSPGRYSAWG